MVACELFGLATTGLLVFLSCTLTLYLAFVRRAREEAALVWTCLEFAAIVAGGGVAMDESCEVSKKVDCETPSWRVGSGGGRGGNKIKRGGGECTRRATM